MQKLNYELDDSRNSRKISVGLGVYSDNPLPTCSIGENRNNLIGFSDTVELCQQYNILSKKF